ncbi:unnamed protein product [Cochlearia groenlandica]
MLVSALLMSVGINSCLCVLLFILYSVLRKQPHNYEVFLPRRLAAGTSKRRRNKVARYIPSVRWIWKSWRPSESELMESSGLDAVVFMRMITFSLKVFLFAGIIGVFVLLPVNCFGDQLSEIDYADWSANSLDLFSVANLKIRSPWLWVHFGAIYLVTAYVCCLLYFEFRYIGLKRIEHFHSSKPQPHQFTILVRNIPASDGNSVSDTVDKFFRENHSSTYLSHVVIHRTSKLRSIVDNAKKLYKKVKSKKPDSHRVNKAPMRFFSRKNTPEDHYEKMLEELEHNIRLGQAEVSLPGKEVRAAFVSFKSRYGSAMALHMPQSINPTYWLTEPAPEPSDVHWPFFSASFMQKWLAKIVIVFACLLLTILFLVPVVLVQGLTNLSALEYFFPFLTLILSMKIVSQIITGYLPSLILQTSLKIVPPIMEFLSSIQGHICHSEIQKSACNKVIWFTIWNVFFATVFSGSALSKLSLFLNPKEILIRLAVGVPAQASFFIAYVVTTGWTDTLTELFRVVPFMVSYVKRSLEPTDDKELVIPPMRYHRDTPRVLFFGLLGITYFFLAPLILPFILLYFVLAYVIYRNQFINVYEPKYETGGMFWPMIHYTMIFSLVLMQAIAIGLFALKKMELATYLLVPLPIFTLLFNEFCRKRFMPIFNAYPAEVLTKRDKEDRNDPRMDGFYNNLVSAYQDPALLPLRFAGSRSDSSLTSPLLSSSEV